MKIPDAAYVRAYGWLERQKDGASRCRLIAELKRQTWLLQNDGAEEPPDLDKIIHANESNPNMLICFEKRGLLLSEDETGKVYAWLRTEG